MVFKTEPVIVENLRGGDGHAEIYHILTKDELKGHANLFARIVLKPHCSIGYHQHIGEYEPIYVISGNGIFTDNDKNEIPVSAGDACKMNPGEFHGIKNASETEDLVIIGLVLNA